MPSSNFFISLVFWLETLSFDFSLEFLMNKTTNVGQRRLANELDLEDVAEKIEMSLKTEANRI